MPDPIQYIQREQIDIAKWDQCIDTADNGLILIVFNGRFANSVRLYECDLCGSDEELLKRAKERLRKS